MMILRSAPPSPFGRKARIAAAVLGLDKEIDVQATDTNDPNDMRGGRIRSERSWC